jgi:hypothetical protein
VSRYYGHLVYFVVISYIHINPFWNVVPRKIWQPLFVVRNRSRNMFLMFLFEIWTRATRCFFVKQIYYLPVSYYKSAKVLHFSSTMFGYILKISKLNNRPNSESLRSLVTLVVWSTTVVRHHQEWLAKLGQFADDYFRGYEVKQASRTLADDQSFSR